MSFSAQQAYQQNQITTASPRELVLLLYNGGIKYLSLAKSAIEARDYEQAHRHLMRTQDILTELILGLNHEYEISKQLEALYTYMKDRLIMANMKKDISMIVEVLALFVEFRDTWKQAIEIVKNQSNVAGIKE